MDEEQLKAMSAEIGDGLGLEDGEDKDVAGGEQIEAAEAAPAVPTAPEAAPVAAPVTGEPAQKVPEPAPNPNASPSTWRPEAKAVWDALPQIAKDEIRKRELDVSRGIHQYAEKAKVADAFETAVAPYAPILRQHGIDPIRRSRELMEINFRLATGSEAEKLDIIRSIARDNGIDPSLLDPSNAPYESPQEKALRERNRMLESHMQEAQTRQRMEIQHSITMDLDAFASNPANAHFDRVSGTMAQLIQSGQASNLQDAYDKAVWLDPGVREMLVNQQLHSQSATQAATSRTDAARRATAANLKHMQPEPVGRMAQQKPTMEDSLRASYAALMNSKE